MKAEKLITLTRFLVVKQKCGYYSAPSDLIVSSSEIPTASKDR